MFILQFPIWRRYFFILLLLLCTPSRHWFCSPDRRTERTHTYIYIYIVYICTELYMAIRYYNIKLYAYVYIYTRIHSRFHAERFYYLFVYYYYFIFLCGLSQFPLFVFNTRVKFAYFFSSTSTYWLCRCGPCATLVRRTRAF